MKIIISIITSIINLSILSGTSLALLAWIPPEQTVLAVQFIVMGEIKDQRVVDDPKEGESTLYTLEIIEQLKGAPLPKNILIVSGGGDKIRVEDEPYFQVDTKVILSLNKHGDYYSPSLQEIYTLNNSYCFKSWKRMAALDSVVKCSPLTSQNANSDKNAQESGAIIFGKTLQMPALGRHTLSSSLRAIEVLDKFLGASIGRFIFLELPDTLSLENGTNTRDLLRSGNDAFFMAAIHKNRSGHYEIDLPPESRGLSSSFIRVPNPGIDLPDPMSLDYYRSFVSLTLARNNMKESFIRQADIITLVRIESVYWNWNKDSSAAEIFSMSEVLNLLKGEYQWPLLQVDLSYSILTDSLLAINGAPLLVPGSISVMYLKRNEKDQYCLVDSRLCLLAVRGGCITGYKAAIDRSAWRGMTIEQFREVIDQAADRE